MYDIRHIDATHDLGRLLLVCPERPLYASVCPEPPILGQPPSGDRYRASEGISTGCGHGKKPSMGLRDYVVFYLIILIGFPTLLCLADYLWTYDRHAEIRNFVREQEMEQENRRTLFSR